MQPVLFHLATLSVPSYGAMLLLAFIVGGLVRARESRRLGYTTRPGYRWVAVGALVGAVVGSKLGMMFYVQPAAWGGLLRDALALETSGKTVIGALAGGYVGVEITKRLVGIQESTGDAFALALPLSFAIGRVGCFLAGCCYGVPSSGPFAVHVAGLDRHPVQLYEAALDLALTALLVAQRDRARRPGNLFKLCLIGYGVIRIAVDPWRGDPRVWFGPLSAAQLACMVAIVALIFALRRPQAAHA